MPRLRRPVIRNFAFDPNVAKGAFEKFAEAFRELADFPYATLRHQIEERGLAHGFRVYGGKIDDP